MAKRKNAAVVTADVPLWLQTMRAITGTLESPGDADNPKILAMADTIAVAYPDMAEYCALYQHDATPWCGLCVAYCMTMAGIRPVYQPPPAPDTDRFLWAEAWASDPEFGQTLTAPCLGCIVVLDGHVTLYEGANNGTIACRGGNQSDSVKVSNYSRDSVVAYIWPRDAGPPPPAERRTLERGDSGADVEELQRILGFPPGAADGEFGPTTEEGVIGFQSACGLEADGVVGPSTWAALDDLTARMAAGGTLLDQDTIQQITTAAQSSALASYSWADRGKAPPGYIVGMACAYGEVITQLEARTSWAMVMAEAENNRPDTDALSWYADEMSDMDWDNSKSGVDTLRHLWALLIGLGMRESSGDHWEGRDQSASNVSADTAESGLFQQSWNSRSCSPELTKLLDAYYADPNGYLAEFNAAPYPTASGLENYGTGQGVAYQWLAKFCPLFACFTAAVGLRKLRQHWGPINRYEVELVEEADELLRQVQEIVAGAEPTPEPEPPPEDAAVVDIQITASGPVVVTVNGTPVGDL